MTLSEQRKALIAGVMALLIFVDGNMPAIGEASGQEWVGFAIKALIASFTAYYGVWVAPNEPTRPSPSKDQAGILRQILEKENG